MKRSLWPIAVVISLFTVGCNRAADTQTTERTTVVNPAETAQAPEEQPMKPPEGVLRVPPTGADPNAAPGATQPGAPATGAPGSPGGGAPVPNMPPMPTLSGSIPSAPNAPIQPALPPELQGRNVQPLPQLPQTVDLTGKVVDEQNKPVAGIRLQVQQVMPDRKISKPIFATTNRRGEFSFPKLSRAGMPNVTLAPGTKGFAFDAQAGPPQWRMENNRVVTTIKLNRIKPTVAGTVVDPEGEPVANATVILADAPGREESKVAEGKTDAKGRFSLDMSKRKQQFDVAWVSVRSAGFPTTWKMVDLQKGLGQLKLQRGVALSGTVRDPAGRPLPNAEVAVASNVTGLTTPGGGSGATIERTKTNGEGLYVFNNVPPGNAIVLVRTAKYEYAYPETQVTLGGEPVVHNLQLRNLAKVTGKVVDAKTGKAIPNAQVTVALEPRKPDDVATRYITNMQTGKTNDRGEFSVPGAPDRLVVVAMAPNYLPARQEASAADGSARVTLKLEPAGNR